MTSGVFIQVQVTFIVATLLVSSTHCHQLQYYILPSTGTNDQDCPTGKVCHSLSYCINDLKKQSQDSNVTAVEFIFLSGEHLLNETVDLEGYHSLSFKGQGQWVQSLYQSTVIIKCTINTLKAFFIRYSSHVSFDMLTIAGCGNGIVLQHINSLHLHHVSVQNNSYNGLLQYITAGFVGIVIIESCNFHRNCLSSGNHYNCSHARFQNTFNGHALVNVTDTTFSFSRYGTGLVFSSLLNNTDTGRFIKQLHVPLPAAGQQAGEKTASAVLITNCSFINNNGEITGGMLIHHEYDAVFTLSVIVTNTKFINNSNYIPDHNSMGYAGGMSVICTAAYIYTSITSSLFINNTGTGAHAVGGLSMKCSDAAILHSSSLSTSNLSSSIHIVNTKLINNYNTDNGKYHKALRVRFRSARADIHISNCLFSNNSGAKVGGLYVHVSADNSLSSVHISSTNFISNHNRIQYYGAGGVLLNVRGNVKIVNCLFQRNNERGLFISPSKPSSLTMKNLTFDKNYGVSIYMILSTGHYSIAIRNVSVTSSTSSHFAYGAVVLVCHQGRSVNISKIKILNNSMTGLYVIGCSIIFQDSPSIIANNSSPNNGGGIWLDSQSTLESTDERGTVSFINNTAVLKGGAIYSDAMTFYSHITVNYGQFDIESRCSMTDLFAKFHNNEAAYGKDIYGGRFSSCYTFTKYVIIIKYNFNDTLNACSRWQWHIFDHFVRLQPLKISSDPFGVCQCTDNGTVDCYNRSIYREVYPGQSISLSLVTVAMCGGVSPGVLATETDGLNITLGNSNQQTGRECSRFTYQVKNYHQSIGKFTIRTGSYSLKGSHFTVKVVFQDCPSGLQLSSHHGVCVCNDVIETLSGVQCNVSSIDHPITRSGNNWLSYIDQYNCTVAHRYCPFDYCNTSTVSLSLDQPDVQCTLNRSGTLCGQCQSGLSLMLGSNQCGSCDNKYLSLVAVFIVAGIALVVFLLVCNLTVSMGSINGLLFYANIVKLNEPVFFPNGASIPVLSQFISWLNLDLGIQTCFFNGLDGYWKTWLQFVFPIYIWILIGGIIIGSHYFGRVSRLFGNNTVPVLATLILMSYSKLLRTITNVLMVATIRCGAKQWNVWSVDGNIHYLSAKRLPLFVVALVFLLIGILYTFLVFTTQWLQHYSGRYCRSSYDPVVKLKPLIDAYSGPYKDKYRYWTGLLLVVRVIVTAIFSYTSSVTPQLNSYIIVIISVLMSLKLSQSVYRNTLLNRLELFFILNLALLSLLNALCVQMKWSVSSFVSFASVALSLAIFLAIVCIHAAIIIKRKYNITFCWEKKQNTQGEEEEPLLREESPEVELYSPARVINRRESLIFDLNID